MSLTSESGVRAAGRARRPGRPPTIDAAAIGGAVVTVGFREVTFASVADRLGVGQATVYRHAANRDELVRLGLEEAVSGFAWPDLTGPSGDSYLGDGRWRPAIRRPCMTYFVQLHMLLTFFTPHTALQKCKTAIFAAGAGRYPGAGGLHRGVFRL